MSNGRAASLLVLLATIISAVLPATEFVSPYTVTRNVKISDTLDLAATAKTEGLSYQNKIFPSHTTAFPYRLMTKYDSCLLNRG